MSPYRPPNEYLPTAYVPGSYAPPYAAPAFNLADFIRLLDARRALIFKIAAAVILGAVVVAILLPTVYASSAVVMLDPRKNSVTDMSAVLAQVEGDPASLQNQIQILTSRDLAAKVIAKLRLEDDPEFNPALARPGIGQVLSDLSAALNPRNWFGKDDAGTETQRLHDRVLDVFAKHVDAGANGL
ncbi:MAG TPA: Wzz/FepE/Etk N-terminal domain-containing protein, partial [Rhizomicrobium sp.]|nr:Wzz/FepE/Etk N-terminal domain-containing protein [Rhizomicrobium sp.]